MAKQRSPLEISYAPGSYTTLGEDIQPSSKPHYHHGSSSHYSRYLGDKGRFMSDEEWEAVKERALVPPPRTMVHTRKSSLNRDRVRDVIGQMDEWRALNRGRPKAAAIPDQRRYFEDLIRRMTEEDRRSGESDFPYPDK